MGSCVEDPVADRQFPVRHVRQLGVVGHDHVRLPEGLPETEEKAVQVDGRRGIQVA